MSDDQQTFLRSRSFAVAGVSSDRSKYGNIVFRALLDFVADDPERRVYALNPKLAVVEQQLAFPNLAALPDVPEALSIVTPPAVTEQIVAEAIDAGVQRIWMQPGAQHTGSIAQAEHAGINVIHGGPCILVALKLL